MQAGGRSPIEESQNSNFTYYSRFYSGKTVPHRIGPAITPMGIFSILTILADNDTWSVTLYTPGGKPAMRALRDPAIFHRIVAACPRQAHWLDGTPITPILPMAGIGDRYRRFFSDRRPIVTGFVAVGDASICTNPAGGRGLSLGLLQAQALRKALREHTDDVGAFAAAYDAETERQVLPLYRNQLATDRIRIAEMNALFDGTPLPEPNPVLARFFAAAYRDADVFRAMLESYMCLTDLEHALARPHVAAKMAEFKVPPSPPPAPIDRERLFGLLAA
jgi:2-polyprenyl-6-methoxyphenol hydroxylase-like FAD-dependent oxidoreductase